MGDFHQCVSGLRTVFTSGKTRQIKWREEQLKAMLRMVDDCGKEMSEVIYKDLHKPELESFVVEIEFLRGEIINALNNIDEWTKPEYVKKNYMVGPFDTPYIYREPYGVVLIIGAWNYPIQLTLHVLVGAIVAGNCAVIKPSELSLHTAQLLERILPEYLDSECIKVVNGGVPVTTSLLTERWDYILYTGSSAVGKIVMQAASKHLTPVTLEMGGKSPCIVDSTANLDIAAKRILWGKFVNAGQTCVAPDYILCVESVKEKLVSKILAHMKAFYGDDAQKSDSYGRIINIRHWSRLKKVLDSHQSGTVHGGRFDESDLYIEPTIIADASPEDAVMQDEIFGPILPILTISNVEDAIDFINEREKPLALYIFTSSQRNIDSIQTRTSSGSICVNDCLMQGSLNTLPFGGVGNSGLGGGYHGKHSYETFSHKKAFLHRATIDEPILGMRYPPYTDRKLTLMKTLTKQTPKRKGIRRLLPFFMLTAVLAFLVKVFGLGRYLPLAFQNALKMD